MYSTAASAAIFFVCGIFAVLIHVRESLLWIGAPMIASVTGAAISFLFGAVPTLFLAVIYYTIPAAMSDSASVAWGLAEGIVISLFNAGLFRKIV